MKKIFIMATVLLVALVSASSLHAQQRITTQGGVQRLAAEMPTQASGQSMQLPTTRYVVSSSRTTTTLPARTATAPAYTAPRHAQRLGGYSRQAYQPTNMASDIASSAANTAYRTTYYTLSSQINRGINTSIRNTLNF